MAAPRSEDIVGLPVLIAVISTTAMAAGFRFYLRDPWGASGLILLSPQWLPALSLAIACVATWRLMKRIAISVG